MSETVGWLAQAALPWLPGALWCAWFLWCVNWRRAWGVLAGGGWVGVVLLTFLTALAWSQIFPRPLRVLGAPIPNFWWQLGACASLAVVALFCGWLQDRLGWAPAEVSFDPPADHADHGHHQPSG